MLMQRNLYTFELKRISLKVEINNECADYLMFQLDINFEWTIYQKQIKASPIGPHVKCIWNKMVT